MEVIAVSVIIFCKTFIGADLYSPEDTGVITFIPIIPIALATSTKVIATASINTSPVYDAYPAMLVIPKLGIHANVQYVGVNSKGNIGTPNNFTSVAWYSHSAIPGEMGTAIIDGHVDNGLALAGVFKHLSDLVLGDHITIVTKGGDNIGFIITSVQAYDYDHVPPEALFGNTSDAKLLKLITCSGIWVPSGHTYNERLIVTAERVI